MTQAAFDELVRKILDGRATYSALCAAWAYKNDDELAEKAPGIVAIAEAQGLTISDLENAHVKFEDGNYLVLGFWSAYMIYWAISEKRKDIADRLAAERESIPYQDPMTRFRAWDKSMRELWPHSMISCSCGKEHSMAEWRKAVKQCQAQPQETAA